MPLYYATLVLRLEAESDDEAQRQAEDVADTLCDESFTDCCHVEGVEREAPEHYIGKLARGLREIPVGPPNEQVTKGGKVRDKEE